jgi:succinoglycan biosynthesis transport protein ExoP
MGDSQQQVGKLVRFLSHNLRLILICLLCGLTVGLAVYLLSPKSYQSTALIMYERQQINPTKMSPDVRERTVAMVNTLSQQITSRTNLEELIKSHGLYSELQQKLPMEDVVSFMRNQINLRPAQGGVFGSKRDQEGDVFAVSFAGAEPRKVQQVTNDLASKFVEENIRFREERVTETSAYIKDELQMAKAALDKKEDIMRDYKLKYFNEMPQQRDSNISRLNSMQDQYQQIQNSIQEMERTKVMLQEQINLWMTALSSSPGTPGTAPQAPSELEKVRQELESLRSKYTPNHPDVKRLEKRLAELQAEQGTASADTRGKEKADQPGKQNAREGGLSPKSQPAKLQLQLKEIEIKINQLSQEQGEIQKQIKKVQKWVEAAPVREAEWSALTRDYQQLQQHYQDLVTRNLEAQSAESLEKRQKGSQFKIIEPANYPEAPFWPDFQKIMLLAAVSGLGAGVALAFGLEFFNTSFKDINDLESYLGIKVNCAIPMLQTAREKTHQRLRIFLWTAVLLTAYVLLSGSMLWLWHKGLIVI